MKCGHLQFILANLVLKYNLEEEEENERKEEEEGDEDKEVYQTDHSI